jgi:2-polyprenyl-3-methyl-5-hydroxy-6-metoxy-1,4-benzoquinol methylase
MGVFQMLDPDYPFGSSDHERRRLMRQAYMLSDATERLFRNAGIGPGMRVLDVGSGAGDVAFLARSLVGDNGEVIGTDRDPEQIAFASHRARSLGYANVGFLTSDYPSLVLDAPVDAIVGRLILVFAKDPTLSLAGVCQNLRPGGVVAFLESNMQFDAPVLVEPRDVLAGKVARWIVAGLGHSGLQSRLGLKLFGIMKTAGLEPSPQIEAIMQLAHGPDGLLFPYLADLVRSLLPSIIASGAATSAEIDIDTLEQRLVADVPTTGVVGTIAAGYVGVWARKP